MEALSSSAFLSSFPETRPAPSTPTASMSASQLAPLKSPRVSPAICLAVRRGEAAGGDGDGKPSANTTPNAFGQDSPPFPQSFARCVKSLHQLICDAISRVLGGCPDHDQSVVVAQKDDSGHQHVKAVHESLEREKPLSVPYGSGTAGGTKAGLFRTPFSGGVQSATSAHGLPPPALAVRNLMEQARFAHLCTVMSRMHHRREGYPFGSLVDFAPDSMGHPIFSFSPLAIHTRNLLADPRCTLVVQIPGWTGLSNARVTLFGDVYPLPESQQEWAHKQYIAKHQQGPSQQWGNFYYFRMMNISDIYFIGGFGTVAWIDVKEYEALKPDKIAIDGGEQSLKKLNAMFSKPLRQLLSKEGEVDDAAFISIDSKGTDIRVRQGAQFNIQRIHFDEGHSVETLDQAKAAISKLINKARLPKLKK